MKLDDLTTNIRQAWTSYRAEEATQQTTTGNWLIRVENVLANIAMHLQRGLDGANVSSKRVTDEHDIAAKARHAVYEVTAKGIGSPWSVDVTVTPSAIRYKGTPYDASNLQALQEEMAQDAYDHFAPP